VLVPNFNTVAGIRAVDNPTNSGTLTAKLVTPPAHGSLVLNADGTFTYNQFANFPGLDAFSYQVNDGSQDSNVATIRLVSPQFHYIEKLYHDTLNRTAADGDIMYWVNLDPNGVNRAATAQVFLNSDEYRSNEINGAYQKLLGRPLDPSGQIYWLGQMRAGLPIEAVMASITGAPEYAAAHGGTASGVVAGLYQDLLGRGASANDIAYWTSQMSRGLSTPAIALAFMGSTEYRTDVISGFYQTYLHHVPDQAGLRNWLNYLAIGLPRTSVQAGILASSEYFNAL
jgi:hypothetical protein